MDQGHQASENSGRRFAITENTESPNFIKNIVPRNVTCQELAQPKGVGIKMLMYGHNLEGNCREYCNRCADALLNVMPAIKSVSILKIHWHYV